MARTVFVFALSLLPIGGSVSWLPWGVVWAQPAGELPPGAQKLLQEWQQKPPCAKDVGASTGLSLDRLIQRHGELLDPLTPALSIEAKSSDGAQTQGDMSTRGPSDQVEEPADQLKELGAAIGTLRTAQGSLAEAREEIAKVHRKLAGEVAALNSYVGQKDMDSLEAASLQARARILAARAETADLVLRTTSELAQKVGEAALRGEFTIEALRKQAATQARHRQENPRPHADQGFSGSHTARGGSDEPDQVIPSIRRARDEIADGWEHIHHALSEVDTSSGAMAEWGSSDFPIAAGTFARLKEPYERLARRQRRFDAALESYNERVVAELDEAMATARSVGPAYGMEPVAKLAEDRLYALVELLTHKSGRGVRGLRAYRFELSETSRVEPWTPSYRKTLESIAKREVAQSANPAADNKRDILSVVNGWGKLARVDPEEQTAWAMSHMAAIDRLFHLAHREWTGVESVESVGRRTMSEILGVIGNSTIELSSKQLHRTRLQKVTHEVSLTSAFRQLWQGGKSLGISHKRWRGFLGPFALKRCSRLDTLGGLRRAAKPVSE